MSRIHNWLLGALVAAAIVGPIDPAQGADKESEVEFSLPLQDGKLNVNDVIDKVSESMGIKTAGEPSQLDWSIDVKSMLGQVQLNLFDRLAGGVIRTRVDKDQIIVTLDREQLSNTLAKTGSTLDGWMSDLTGRARQRQSRPFGITFLTTENDRASPKDLSPAPSRVVLLVHGLDDPGFMWRDLIPHLQKAGYHVARFEYPNDGPIGEGADLLANSLQELKAAGVERVDVVAHSMGGLVTRDVLTRPAYYAGDGAAAKAAKFPSIDRLIMLGTPNHGSKWARLRMLSELREHFYRAWDGETGWFSGFDADGAGEAGVDLLPESDFLRRLNERPLAKNTQYTIVAGQCGTELAHDVMQITEKARKLAETPQAPHWLREMLSPENQELAVTMLGDTVNGLGDGCVSVESAKLNGVEDFTVVAGNHLSMVVRIGPAKNEDTVPPAIAIVMDRLAKGD
jgi:pimeloyl-ACP methyl ester carboxylesterase